MRTFLKTTASASILLFSISAGAATHKVGPGADAMFKTPCAAITAQELMDNDIIEIDATAVYEKDYCELDKSGITLRGIGGGRAKIDAKLEGVESLPKDNGIWVINGDNTTIENIEFTGAKVLTFKGAGIHVKGENLTVKNCSFHDNDSGIRTVDSPKSEVLVESSEFGYNGDDLGFGHNIDIQHVAKFTLRYSYSHHAKSGDLLLSRATESFILYNRLTDEADGVAQHQINLPNGGRSYVIGNVLHKSVATPMGNTAIIAYAKEGSTPLNPAQELFAVNNTLVSDKTTGTIFIDADSPGDVPPIVRNNIFVGGPGTICTVPEAVEMDNNFTTGEPLFQDQASFDYRLKAESPAIDKGAEPGMGSGFDLAPTNHYVHVAMTEVRPTNGAVDIGAYEVPPEGTGGAGGAGGAGGGGGAGGAGGGHEASSSTASSTTGGATSTGGADSGDEGGCGCRVGDSGSSKSAAFVAFGLALLFGVRRRKSGLL